MLNSKKITFTTEEIGLIISSLNLFMSNEIENIPFKSKVDYNLLAISTINKLRNRNTDLNIDSFKVMTMALLNIYDIVEETNSVPIESVEYSDTEKYLSLISDVLDKIEQIFNANGISIFSDNQTEIQ